MVPVLVESQPPPTDPLERAHWAFRRVVLMSRLYDRPDWARGAYRAWCLAL